MRSAASVAYSSGKGTLSSIVVAALWTAALVQAEGRLRVYTYSRDSAVGFKDELLESFRRELGKHIESIAEVAYTREEAQVSIQFLGQGELTVELGEDEPPRYLWRFDETASRTWALVRIGKFSKEFAVEGRGARDLGRLAKTIADWIRENEPTIRGPKRGSRGSSLGDASRCPQTGPWGEDGPPALSLNLL